MSGRRVLVLYGSLLLGFAVVLCRLFWLCSNTAYAARAEAQSTATLMFPARRGNFYDCNGHLLTGLGEQWLALSLPGEGSYTKLYPYASKTGQAMLYQKRNASRPFLVEVMRDVSAMGAWCYAVPRRYGDAPLASALLGYLDGEGHGVAGLEAALEDLLSGTGAQDKLVCAVNAQGKLRSGTEPELVKSDSGAVGVQLTLSRSIQRAAEAVAVQTMQSGCILVLDAASAKVRACASTPGFDPENVSASLNAPDSPLVNRAFQAYAVGSVFKPVLAAAALEAGKTGLVWDCPGYCVVDGQVFRCAGGVPHGEVNLAAALKKSCNGYFIRLGQQLGAETLLQMSRQLGFGQEVPVAGALHADAGKLPSAGELAQSGQLANFSFGQGGLLASPVQIAAMMNTIASGGVYRTPFFVCGSVDETDGTPLETLAHPQSRRVMSAENAALLRKMLQQVVEEGTAQDAAGLEEGAGGKTGTAQTGQFTPDGTERKNLWFAGFYPAQQPRYTIVVLQDGQVSTEHSSAAIFARLCAMLDLLA